MILCITTGIMSSLNAWGPMDANRHIHVKICKYTINRLVAYFYNYVYLIAVRFFIWGYFYVYHIVSIPITKMLYSSADKVCTYSVTKLQKKYEIEFCTY